MSNKVLEIIDGKLSVNGIQGGNFVKGGSEIFAGLLDVIGEAKRIDWENTKTDSYFLVNYTIINEEFVKAELNIDKSKLQELISLTDDKNKQKVNGAGTATDLTDIGGIINVNGIPFAYGGTIPTVQLFIDNTDLFGSIDQEKNRSLIYNTLNGEISACTEDMCVLLKNFCCKKTEEE